MNAPVAAFRRDAMHRAAARRSIDPIESGNAALDRHIQCEQPERRHCAHLGARRATVGGGTVLEGLRRSDDWTGGLLTDADAGISCCAATSRPAPGSSLVTDLTDDVCIVGAGMGIE